MAEKQSSMVQPSHHHWALGQTSFHWAVILSPHLTVLVCLILLLVCLFFCLILLKPRDLFLSVT